MKITHISLNARVTDGFTYQDNLLPKFHHRLGYDVSMITSKYIWNNNGKIIKDERDQYINEYGIKTIRLNNTMGTNYKSKFKKYNDLYSTLENERPDILFIHGVQSIDIIEIVRYIKSVNKIKVYVDNHADFGNSAKNWLSKNILHKVVWKKMANLIEPYTKKFYGVSPARVDFLLNMYDLPQEKVEFLAMGADDKKIELVNDKYARKNIREQYNVENEDFLIVTGGKIDTDKKNVLNLMKAIKNIPEQNVKLLVYGSVVSEMREEVDELLQNDSIEYIGWINSDQSYEIFSAADLVVFPSGHSVYWEQVVAMGVPLMVKYWEGTTHIDIGGNCIFLYEDSMEEILTKIENLLNYPEEYQRMKKSANSPKKDTFLYSNIAKNSLEI